MSSLRKVESCRENGAKSRGPITPEGKERSAMNSLQHGFAASKIVLAAEDRPQFDAMRDGFIEKHQPADEVESSLVDEMVVANWRLYRIWAGEATLFDNKIRAFLPNPPPRTLTPERLFGQAFQEFAGFENPLKLMMRYEANCRWQYDRALRNLLSLRKAASQPPESDTGKIVTPFSQPVEPSPRQEPGTADEIHPGALLPAPEPNEPNPTNEHPISEQRPPERRGPASASLNISEPRPSASGPHGNDERLANGTTTNDER